MLVEGAHKVCHLRHCRYRGLGMRILAVDDDPIILELLRGSLSKHAHYDLVCCETAEKALDAISCNIEPFDCFLLDVMLPGIDGIDLCAQLRKAKQYRTTPIIMITASRAPDLMRRAFSAGATDYVSKPLNGVELGARINAAGMLNESLHRERMAQHSLTELSTKLRLKFDEAVRIDTAGVTELAALENDLLRLPIGAYAMNLFCIDVMGLRGIHRAVGGAQFRYHLDRVATAAAQALGNRNWKLAYTGGGRFMGVVMGRGVLDRDSLLEDMNEALAEGWDLQASATPMPPSLRVASIGDKRIWTGLSASNALREQLVSTDMLHGSVEAGEDRLFARFNKAVS